MSFVKDSLIGYASVDVGLFKDSSLLGTFPLPTPDTTHVDPINMINYVGRLPTTYDPWVISDPFKVESYRATLFLPPVELSYDVI